jgi:rare lipoprotein A
LTPRLAQREVALAGIALLAAVVAVALVTGRSGSGTKLPKPVGRWSTALAGVRSVGGLGKRTACGVILQADTNGVSHPVLPCGAKIFLRLDGKSVLTQVIDRGPYVPGRAFDLTEPLAAKLGLQGVQRIRWAYAAKN